MNLHTLSINSVTSDAPPKDVNATAVVLPAPATAVATLSESQAKEPKANNGADKVGRCGVRVGEAVAVRPATSEFMDVTAGETAPNDELSACRTIDATDVLWGAGTPWARKENRKRTANVPAVETLENLGVTAGETAPNSNSGDGLGNLQPGSNTWGGDNVATAPSGRARDRAICPAVAGCLSVSDGAANCSLPSGESEPSVTLALAPSESSSCGGVDGHPRKATGEAESADVRQTAGFESCPQDFTSLPTHPIASVTSASRSEKETTPLFSSDDPELDAIISALEAEWRADGIVMNATALRVAASSLIHPSASCVSIPST